MGFLSSAGGLGDTPGNSCAFLIVLAGECQASWASGAWRLTPDMFGWACSTEDSAIVFSPYRHILLMKTNFLFS